MSESCARRALLIGADRQREEVRLLFARPALAGWGLVEADTFARARFVLQAQTCDAVVLDGSRFDADGLAWLAEQSEAGVLFLADASATRVAAALNHGAHAWLPRDRAFAAPLLLAATLKQVAQVSTLRRRLAACTDEAHLGRRRAEHLLELLWEASPTQPPAHWLTQRHLLERLEEELARTKRHGGPLSVVLGEVRPGEGALMEADRLASWAAHRVGEVKRRCDVAGQYGLRGFMLLLPRGGAAEAEGACRRLRGVLERPAEGGPYPPLHACFGTATVAPEADTVQGLLRRAEEGLERARGEGAG